MAETNKRTNRLRTRPTRERVEPVPHAPLLLRFAAEMKACPTQAEFLLWQELRATQLGVRFDRQVVIGPYIVDFACRPLLLIVEVDGDIHDLPAHVAYDAERTSDLELVGYRVLRFRNEAVEADAGAVAGLIKLAIAQRIAELGVAA